MQMFDLKIICKIKLGFVLGKVLYLWKLEKLKIMHFTIKFEINMKKIFLLLLQVSTYTDSKFRP